MSQSFLKLIQTGRTEEVTAALDADPGLAAARDPQGVSTLLWSVYTGQTAGARLPAPAVIVPGNRAGRL